MRWATDTWHNQFTPFKVCPLPAPLCLVCPSITVTSPTRHSHRTLSIYIWRTNACVYLSHRGCSTAQPDMTKVSRLPDTLLRFNFSTTQVWRQINSLSILITVDLLKPKQEQIVVNKQRRWNFTCRDAKPVLYQFLQSRTSDSLTGLQQFRTHRFVSC
jgi:hypothetical protein